LYGEFVKSPIHLVLGFKLQVLGENMFIVSIRKT